MAKTALAPGTNDPEKKKLKKKARAAAEVEEVVESEPVEVKKKKKKAPKLGAAEKEEKEEERRPIFAVEKEEAVDAEVATPKKKRKKAAVPIEEPAQAEAEEPEKRKKPKSKENTAADASAEQPQRREEPTTSWNEFRVFVSGMPWNIDEATLRRDFTECGEIDNLHLVCDRNTGESKGIAFITFKDQAAFDAALAFDGDDYGGRKLHVKKAEDKGKKTQIREPGPKPEGCNSVVVKGLAFEVTEDELKKIFKKCGAKKIGLLKDKATGRSRGTARLDFDNDTNATGVDEAMKLNGTELSGKAFYMDYCQPQW